MFLETTVASGRSRPHVNPFTLAQSERCWHLQRILSRYSRKKKGGRSGVVIGQAEQAGGGRRGRDRRPGGGDPAGRHGLRGRSPREERPFRRTRGKTRGGRLLLRYGPIAPPDDRYLPRAMG